MSGLGGAYWAEVIEVLRSVIPFYDRVNKAISLGNDTKFRLRAVKGRINLGSLLLDAGSGYGNMSRVVLSEMKGVANIVMYDPIPQMLFTAKELFKTERSSPGMSAGVFEYLPFKNDTFDAVLCGYSLRDAIVLNKAISEFARVLRGHGLLIIVDLGKPDSVLLEKLVSFYLRYVLGIIAFVVAGRAGLKFRTLHGTYLKWPKNSVLKEILNEHFDKVEFETKLLGGAIIIAASKSVKQCRISSG